VLGFVRLVSSKYKHKGIKVKYSQEKIEREREISDEGDENKKQEPRERERVYL
jgi:hypothetical protein